MFLSCQSIEPVIVGPEDELSSFVGKLITIRGEYIHRKIPYIMNVQVGRYPLKREGDKIEATGILISHSLSEENANKARYLYPNIKAGTFYFLKEPNSDEMAIPKLITKE